jgi:hypothetical protein
MKNRIAVLLLALLAFAAIAAAQTVNISWQASPTTGIASYKVYRAPCTGTVTANVCSAEGTFATIGSVAVPAVTYADSTALAGALYSYYVTAVCPVAGCTTTPPIVSGESLPSNHTGVSIPATRPQPPGNLTLVSVVRNLLPNGQTTVVAKWQAPPNVRTFYSLRNNGRVLTGGNLVNAQGVYSAIWVGKLMPRTPLAFTVCDMPNGCRTKTI